MNLVYIKYFCDAVREGSLAKAAETNFVTPGAISQGIHRLEEMLNVSLLKHKKREFQLTSAGKQLAVDGDEILRRYSDMQARLQGVNDFQGEIHFGTQQSIAISLLPGLLKNFKKEYPEIIPKFVLGNTTIIKDQLNGRKFDFALCLDNVEFTAHYKEVLFEGNFVLISRKKKPNEFLLTGDTPEVIQFKNNYKKKFKQDVATAMTIKSWGVIKEMVLNSDYVGLVPEYVLTGPELKLIIQDNLGLPRIPYKILAVWPYGREIDNRSKLFIEYCQRK